MKHQSLRLHGLFRPLAAALVLVGFGPAVAEDLTKELTRQPESPEADPDALPANVTQEIVSQWRAHQQPASPWNRLKAQWVKDPSAFSWRADEPWLGILTGPDPKEGDLPQQIGDLFKVLGGAESQGSYDDWVVSRVWKRAAALDPKTPVEEKRALYIRLQRHARVADALTRAAAKVKSPQVSERAWMSKAGPAREKQLAEERAAAETLAQTTKLYGIADAGTWERDALVALTLIDPPADLRLHRRTKAYDLSKQRSFNFNRLDLLETGEKPVVLEHAWLGRITVPPHTLLSVWDLPGLLSADAQRALEQTTQTALRGDDLSADNLEAALPLAHPQIRKAVAATPNAPGAARLRLLLMLFDGTPTPQPVSPTIHPPQRNDREGPLWLH
jgi:hypothetical protein